MLKAGLGIVAVAAVAALFGPFLTPFDPSAQELPMRLTGPSGSHLSLSPATSAACSTT
jgi:peptide/nickel transport system permease protein